MKLSKNWDDFMEKFNQLYGQNSMEFEFEEAKIIEPKKPRSKFDKSLIIAIENKKDD